MRQYILYIVEKESRKKLKGKATPIGTFEPYTNVYI